MTSENVCDVAHFCHLLLRDTCTVAQIKDLKCADEHEVTHRH